jgi:hypothetical protein
MLVFLREDNPESPAAGFLERCPLIEADYTAGAYEMSLRFLCSKADRQLLEDPFVKGVRGPPEEALRAVMDDAPLDISIRAKYATPPELAAFRDYAPGNRPVDCVAGGPPCQVFSQRDPLRPTAWSTRWPGAAQSGSPSSARRSAVGVACHPPVGVRPATPGDGIGSS